jgi:hypothetical protein
VERLAYANNFANDVADLVERERLWKAEEALPDKLYPDEMPEEEKKKKEEERIKKVTEEHEESQTVAKRKGVKMLIHGLNFLKTDVKLILYLLIMHI